MSYAKKEKEREFKEVCESISILQREIEDLEVLIDEKDQEIKMRKDDRKNLSRLYDLGIIDEQGNPIEKLQF